MPRFWRAISPVLVVYADDLLALCHSREQAEQVKARLTVWLAPRDLAFNEDKTRIVHLDEGCDFLGFNIRRYRSKLLTKPSNAALRRIRERLAAEVLALRGSNADAVIAKLNPIIKGWAAYYPDRGVQTGVQLAGRLRVETGLKWAKFSHPNKPMRWVTARYFGMFNPFRQDTWVFGDRASGFYLYKFAWTPIVRHRMVPGRASTDDPALADFWAKRRRRGKLPLGKGTLHLLQMQDSRSPLCGRLLLHADHEPQTPDQWEEWLKVARIAIRKHAVTAEAGNGKPDKPAASRLIHTHCQRRLATGPGR
jgi:RNA-directed DNA polymerase